MHPVYGDASTEKSHFFDEVGEKTGSINLQKTHYLLVKTTASIVIIVRGKFVYPISLRLSEVDS
jgi:hypothetical protein